MQRTQRTEAERDEALRLMADKGVTEAARITGIPKGTIASWGVRRGVTSPPVAQAQAMVEHQKVAWSIRKVALGEKLGTLCEKMAQGIDERLDAKSIAGVRDLAASIAILVDRAQLLTGGVTARTEVVERTPEAEAEVAQVLTRLRSAA
jgi:hypothetical protein